MKILAKTPVSVTLELERSVTPYFSNGKFSITLNGDFLREENRNVFSVFGLEGGTDYEVEACGEKLKFSLPEAKAVCDIKQFGAAGDGVHDDTAAFTAAVNCMPAGSVIKVSCGEYLLTPVFLKSELTVYIDKSAKLCGCPDRSRYPVLPDLIGDMNFGTWQGEEADCFASLFTAYGQSDIAVVGEGVIDCNALAGDWYINHRVKRGAWRPRGMFFNRCENVLLQGITVKNTPSWNIHPYFCKNVKLYDLTLANIASMPTTDGIDADCCNGVEIAGVHVSVGDDCIAIKSGTFEFAKKYGTPCKNIVIRNCLMCEGHGGVVLGSELSGGIEGISVDKCIFKGTDRGLRIKTRRGRGCVGKCGGITFSNIEMSDVKVPFVINMYYNMGDENGHTEYVWTTEKLPIDERTPKIGSFVFENMNCYGVEYSAGAFYGLPESPIESLIFKNVKFRYKDDAEAGFPDMREKNVAVAKQGLDFHFVNNVELKNVSIDGQDGEKFNLEEVGNLVIG